MTLRRCFNVQDHFDRIGQSSPGVVAIYLGARAAELAYEGIEICHKADSFTRFSAQGVVETVEVQKPAPLTAKELPIGHIGRTDTVL